MLAMSNSLRDGVGKDQQCFHWQCQTIQWACES
jgi:hypothetical protein